ncbi:MAG: phosphatase PAP2 family protein [Gammaproteobacteria bacterium]|nr:phosphatase PAP2 family protein [Gammaproteobacteria bacterium]
MEEIFNQLLTWVGDHPTWTGLVIFLVAMSESVAIVGVIVPGVIIMFGIGAMIATGAISFWPAMAWAVAGAVSGDSLSFWLGRHYQDQLRGLWPFSKHPKSLEKGIAFFERYGGKSVAIGRFFGPVRAIIPLVAGMMGMPRWRFFLANLLSALAWAPAYLLPGMVVGASMELASEVAFRLVILLLTLALVIFLTVWLTRHLLGWLQPRSSRILQGLIRWSSRHPRMGRLADTLTDPDHPEAKTLSLLAALLVISVVLFALLVSALFEGAMAAIDQTVLQSLQSLHSPWADQMMVYLTGIANTGIVLSMEVGILLFILFMGHKRTAFYWLSALGFFLISSPLIKALLQIPRPEIVAQIPSDYSFPSGHTLAALLLYGFLAIIMARGMKPAWRWAPYTLAGVIVVLVGFSRLYLGVHWLSDVLGSLLLGGIWLTLLGIAYHHHTRPETHWRALGGSALLVFTLAFGYQSLFLHSAQMDRYQRHFPQQTLDLNRWWQQGWQTLPQQRQDSRGQKNQPLNFQYAGNKQPLEQQLIKQGWVTESEFSFSDVLKMLTPSPPLHSLPILPQVHDGQHESLLMSKSLDGDRRIIVRLWPGQTTLQPDNIPLWLGAVSEQRKSNLLGMVNYAETAPNVQPATAQLIRDLEKTASKRVILKPDGLLLLSTEL